MPTERAMLEAALDRLAVDLRGLAGSMPCIDALEAYLELARPLVDACDGRDRMWVNARVEDIWSACPVVARRMATRIPCNPKPPTGTRQPGGPLADPAPSLSPTNHRPRDPGTGTITRRH